MCAKPKVPEVGQLLYSETLDNNGVVKLASLNIIDTKPEEGESKWDNIEIVMMEDYGDGFEVYSNLTAGCMLAEYTRFATDDDILMFVQALAKQENQEFTTDSWIELLKSSPDAEFIKPSEKERLIELIQGEA